MKTDRVRKTVKVEKKPKIYFDPQTPEEVEYLETLQALLSQKRYGDWDLASEKSGIPRFSVEKAFLRVYSKNHTEAVNALKAVIENRRKLLKQ
ncbi:hypothetical protein [Epilithonimonas xixisoli]|uniref:Uncharacterized protein n=1 Tax=Epilithonimonas xixisoli TaxID=1476462 RepID=A0A4R8I9N8_9FLAO|nr:hypothetical protein [Epilithonimonas xixisoli]TDX86220.1 hypothetical protein B0I22_0330 [Epilithonimonas xixisoli]